MRTLIAIPCMDMMHTPFVISLTGLQVKGEIKFAYSASSLIYDSRNGLARKAIVEKFDRILWLDSDMQFSPDLFKRLSDDLDEGRDFVSGLYFTRKPPYKPVIFKKAGYEHVGEKGVKPVAEAYYDYPEDTVFEVQAAGFGGVMMNVSLLVEIEKAYGLPFSPIMGFGEDISFCMRAQELGKKMYCDSRVKMGHVGQFVYDESSCKELNHA